MLAKFGFDTAENEPCKVCPLSAYRDPVRIRSWLPAAKTLTDLLAFCEFSFGADTDPPGRSTRPAAWSSDVHNPGYDAGGDESADADDTRNESSIGSAGNGACADQRRIEVHLTVLTLAAPSESDALGISEAVGGISEAVGASG